MTKKNNSTGCNPSGEMFGCTPGSGCHVEAVLGVDERGQMVLPKDVREKAGIRTGDKLALISWSRGRDVCCLALMKVEVVGPGAIGCLFAARLTASGQADPRGLRCDERLEVDEVEQ